MSGKRYSKKQKEFIEEKYLDYPIKKLAKMIGGSYTGVMAHLSRKNLVIPPEIVERNRKQSQFKKGMKSHNKGKKRSDYMSKENIIKCSKTQFKKGNVPHNTKYNGHERITKDGYIEIRVKQGSYKLKHLHLWEQINGKLPRGYCLWCLDGNKKNTDPKNWELITRAENLNRNVHSLPPELNRAKKLKTRILKTIENAERP